MASQYISRRGAGGWSTEDVTLPTFAGAYGENPAGVPYRLFAPDLARAVILKGQTCAKTKAAPEATRYARASAGRLRSRPKRPTCASPAPRPAYAM